VYPSSSREVRAGRWRGMPLEAPNGTPLADVIFGVLDALGVESDTLRRHR